jgi:hypothetical protein
MHLWRGFDLQSKAFVLHSCDNPSCFNPDHLFIGTAADNTADMMNKGRGKTHPRKPPPPGLIEMVAAGKSERIIANALGLSRAIVRKHKKRILHHP